MMSAKNKVLLIAVLLIVIAGGGVCFAQTQWVGSWAASQQLMEPQNSLAAEDLKFDFDKAMRDPGHPERLLPAFDSGDRLHPSPAEYAAMAGMIQPALLLPSSSPKTVDGPKIAITFDDLPAHASLPPGETRLHVVTQIIDALRQANVPPTYGFTNGILLQQQPADAAVLKAWRAAGNELGNHTWSHMNLNQHTFEDYRLEIERNEPLLSDSMKDDDWHWFRFPFLAQGDTPGKQAAVRSYLSQHHYKIAGTTMSFADYLYNDPYARCSAKGDTQAIAYLEKTYLAAADESITYYRNISHTLLGRDIPYVLLMHLGAFDARMLPQLLALYQSRGVQFVTLAEAESDDFYKPDTDLSLPYGPDNLEGGMMQRNLTLPPRKLGAPPLDSLCR